MWVPIHSNDANKCIIKDMMFECLLKETQFVFASSISFRHIFSILRMCFLATCPCIQVCCVGSLLCAWCFILSCSWKKLSRTAVAAQHGPEWPSSLCQVSSHLTHICTHLTHIHAVHYAVFLTVSKVILTFFFLVLYFMRPQYDWNIEKEITNGLVVLLFTSGLREFSPIRNEHFSNFVPLSQ